MHKDLPPVWVSEEPGRKSTERGSGPRSSTGGHGRGDMDSQLPDAMRNFGAGIGFWNGSGSSPKS